MSSLYFNNKFKEELDECREHLPEEIIEKCSSTLNSYQNLLTNVDGPCIVRGIHWVISCLMAITNHDWVVDNCLPVHFFPDSISHPKAKEKRHHQYRNKKTGEEIRLDKGDPKETGHDAHDHYHRLNPNKTGDHDAYLDAYGRPVPEGSDASHLYPPEWVWW